MNLKTILSSTIVSGFLLTQSYAMQNDKVYATVNGETIKASDIAVVLKDPRINFDTLPKENKEQVLKELIDKKLLALKALQTSVVESQAYKETLQNTIKTLKQDLALQIWVGELSKTISVSDKEVQEFYTKNKSKFKQAKQFKANHILLKTKKEAQDIIDTLNKSKDLKNDFIKIAKEKSTGPSGKNGGDLGWFQSKRMVPEFALAVEFLKKGTITKKPVKTQFGYHVIYLDDTKDAKDASFDEVKNQIKQLLSQEKFNKKIQTILDTEKKSAKIIYK